MDDDALTGAARPLLLPSCAHLKQEPLSNACQLSPDSRFHPTAELYPTVDAASTSLFDSADANALDRLLFGDNCVFAQHPFELGADADSWRPPADCALQVPPLHQTLLPPPPPPERLCGADELLVKTEPISPAPPSIQHFAARYGVDAQLGAAFPNADLDASSLDIYRDLILRHLVQDISASCSALSIATDPCLWSCDHTCRWLNEMAQQFQLHLEIDQLYFPGRTLCAMTRDELVARCPSAGETLYAQLQIWKTAAEFATTQQQMLCQTGQPMATAAPTDERPAVSLTDWLATFDPTDLSPTHAPPPHSAPAAYDGQWRGFDLLPPPVVSAYSAHRPLSPAGSDSGISADYDELYCGQSPLPTTQRRHSYPGARTGSVHLWQFLRELLQNPDQYDNCVRWLDRAEGVFKIENSHQLARLWGQRKNRTKMNYDKLSRSLRQYYKKNIIRKTGQRQRLIYQFLPPYNFA